MAALRAGGGVCATAAAGGRAAAGGAAIAQSGVPAAGVVAYRSRHGATGEGNAAGAATAWKRRQAVASVGFGLMVGAAGAA